MPAVHRPPQAEALDLPELDKGDDSEDVDVGTFDLSLGADDGEIPEQDALVDAFEVDIQLLTDSGGNEAATDLDVGVSDLLGDLPEVYPDRDSEAPPSPNAELDIHLDTPLESDDPSSDAELGDDGLEALPELLREEGDGDAGPDVDGAVLLSAPEGEIPKGPSYESEWLSLGSACSALTGDDSVVLAAGANLMRFGADRHSAPLPPRLRVISMALLESGGVALATTRGLLEIAPGREPVLQEVPESLRGSGADVVELTTAGEKPALWARFASGALVRRRAGAWERHDAGGAVQALTSRGHGITLLVLTQRPALQRSSDAGTSFRELLLPEAAAAVALGAAPTAQSWGNVIALADATRGLCVSSDGGETFRMVTGAVNVTAITIGEHAGAPAVFAALHREGKDVTELIAVDPVSAKACSIGELTGEPDEEAEETGRTQALLFASGHLWAAGSYGLVRLRA